jgi:thymidine phosphorylase
VTDITEPRIPFLGRSESLVALDAALSGNNRHPWLSDHVETCLTIAGEALLAAKLASTRSTAVEMARVAVSTGRVRAAFHANLETQGANVHAFNEVLNLHRSSLRQRFFSQRGGYIAHIAIERLARILARFNQSLPGQNDGLGLICLKRKGERVEAGEPLLEVRVGSSISTKDVETVAADAGQAIEIVDYAPGPIKAEILSVVRNSMMEESNS